MSNEIYNEDHKTLFIITQACSPFNQLGTLLVPEDTTFAFRDVDAIRVHFLQCKTTDKKFYLDLIRSYTRADYIYPIQSHILALGYGSDKCDLVEHYFDRIARIGIANVQIYGTYYQRYDLYGTVKASSQPMKELIVRNETSAFSKRDKNLKSNQMCLMFNVEAANLTLAGFYIDLTACYATERLYYRHEHHAAPVPLGWGVAIRSEVIDPQVAVYHNLIFRGGSVPFIFTGRELDPSANYTPLIDVNEVIIHDISRTKYNPFSWDIFVYDFTGNMKLDYKNNLNVITRAGTNVFRVTGYKTRVDLVQYFPNAIKYDTASEFEDRWQAQGINLYQRCKKLNAFTYVAAAWGSVCLVIIIALLCVLFVKKPKRDKHPTWKKKLPKKRAS